MRDKRPRIAILGAGPVGLEAALAAAERGYTFTVYEAAQQVAGQVREWGHVRLFTPWELDASARMRSALAAEGRVVPQDQTCPTGAELVARLLDPISELPQIRQRLRLGVRVQRVGRQGLLKHDEIGTQVRAQRPFRLLVQESSGEERLEQADIVLDCTGNTEPNTLGDGGIPALGEKALDGAIRRQVPSFEVEAQEWAGKTVLLVGAGHSAQTALGELVALAEKGSGSRIVWAVRSKQPTWGAFDDDPLVERVRLTTMADELAKAPPACLEVHKGVVVEAVLRRAGRYEVSLRSEGGTTRPVVVDRILSLTGQVGDHMLYRQLQVHECYATSGPMKLAAALMGSSGDCMQQATQGAETLANPEPLFFILGSKSYGRRNDFLMRTGWQQVDAVFQLLEE